MLRSGLALGALLALAFALAGTPAPSAFAQDVNLQALIDRLDRLERDLGGLQRRVIRGRAVAGKAAAAPAGANATTPVQQEMRLSALEEQLRSLTGDIEEAQHHLNQMSDRLDKLFDDVQIRFAGIEGQLAALTARPAVPIAQAAQAAAPPAPAGERPSQPKAAAGERTVVVAHDANSDRYQTMGVLGKLPAPPAAAADAGGEKQSVAAVVPPVAAPPSMPADPQQAYDAAYRLLQRADYEQAENAFRQFIERFPDHKLTGNAYYWLGETYYVRNRYEQAAVTFARGYKDFPDGPKAPDNLLKLGMSLYGMNKGPQACATFDKLESDHPDAPAAILNRLGREREKVGCS